MLSKEECREGVSSADVSRLLQALDQQVAQGDFRPLLEGAREVLSAHGISADRIQLPMTKPFGFRHPTLWGVLLTWTSAGQFEDTFIITHDEAAADGLPDPQSPTAELFEVDAKPRSPYFLVSGDRDWFLQCDVADNPHGFSLFDKLASQGIRHYACFRLLNPATRRPAVMSLASAEPFPSDLRERLQPLRALLGLAYYACYRTSQAHEIAQSYVGRATGPRVLQGQIARGSSEHMEAGIMFCDVRGFTALSQEMGAAIIPIMNQVFEAVGDEAEQRGGEILKFIGDAMLLVFPTEERSAADVAHAMVETVREAQVRVAAVAHETRAPVSVGFGCHIGAVIYGNIGTPRRLDFTVMGPAVNLASRLESLCKPIEASGVFSKTVQEHCPDLQSAGAFRLKGISEEVPVWVLLD